MKSALVILVFFLALSCAKSAEMTLPNPVAGRSVSGQFQIYTPRWDTRIRPPTQLTSNTNYLELDPALLTISCERVKQALHRELGITAPTWRGRIHLTMRRATAADEPVYIVSEKKQDDWAYHVGLPQAVARQRFIRGMVQVLLLEQANRRSTGRSAEIPVWLSEGLTQLLLLRPDVELTPSPTPWDKKGIATGPTVFDIRRRNPHKPTLDAASLEEAVGLKRVIWIDPLEDARRALRSNPPLTVEQLSWPTEEQLESELYRRSAELFVSELLRLENGRENLRAMVDELAEHYNWQTAFFRTFTNQFSRQLDLEKWWALQVVHFTGHDPTELWSPEESFQRLDKILRTPIEVRHAANELPARTDAPLQSIIREWDSNPNQQQPSLKNKVRDLEMFRLRAATQIVPLADDYRKTLEAYLERRQKIDFGAVARPGGPRRLHPAAQEALRQLDALDTRREAFRPKEEPAGVQSAQNEKPAP